ncbi:hypothetical protein SAMN02745181_2547 [Rubritalea squalenifaciens DSM 18772]|uniref:Uncharacterized protein n=1 Tax=Rubritalea squalenifaciens DSM 18772 TaxID=1123071 RepID=A0A1M6LZ36_9BACT|nr:hypothetical protein SAMN02745181_2547 [Rubritalea squalenifaciens DSM 18772]
MDWHFCKNPISPIIALQMGVILGGSLVVSGFMKLSGYTDDPNMYRWNNLPIFLHHWGLILLLLPAGWIVYLSVNTHQNGYYANSRLQIALGVVLTTILICIFYVGAMEAAFPSHRVRIAVQ